MRGNDSACILIAVDPFAGWEPAAVWVAADQGFGSVSTLDGWLPLTIQLVAGLAWALAIGRFSRRWWLHWMPIVAAAAILTALAVRWYVVSEGLTGDPAPLLFWVWTGLAGAALTALVFGWRSAHWWQRIASAASI